MFSGWGQVRVGESLASDGFGVLDVGLGSPTSLASFGGAIGLNFAHVVTGGHERQDHRASEESGAFNADAVNY
nr:hypothetical protein [Micromonospora acroterricola]